MATTTFKINGKLKYSKLYPEVKDTKYDPDGTYVAIIEVDDETAEAWDKSGVRGKSKYDRSTKTNTITVRRKHASMFEWAAGAPKVLKADGSVRDFSVGPIWTDSVVEAEVQIYDTKTGDKGTRLISVTVLEEAETPERYLRSEDDDVTSTAKPPVASVTPAKKAVEKRYTSDVPF